MRIALDALLLGGHHSGVEQAIEGLARALPEVAPQHEYLLICRRNYASQVPPGLTPFPAPSWVNDRLSRILYEQYALPSALRGRCDVLHAPGYIMPLRWRGPSVLTVYDLIALQFPQYCKRSNVWHYGRMLPRSLRGAGRVVVPTDAVAQVVRDRFPDVTPKLRTIPLGLDRQYRPVGPERVAELRKRLNLPDRFVLCVGNIEPKKNLAAVVQAFDMAAGCGLPHDLVLAGAWGWDYADVTRALAASAYPQRFHLPGYVAQADLPALYTAADLLVQWSLTEGMGLPPLEAMACGTPTLVSDAPALVEVAGPAAQVVPLGPPEGLAEALSALLGDQARLAELRDRGLRHAQQFTWERHAAAVVALYEEVAHASD
ncbi:MAG: glycosyltransferase family 1 protein [Armatimonadia bacterium]